MAVLKYFLCIASSYNLENPRVPENRQTENLGDFDWFLIFRMPTFQILRFAEIEINPCNPTSNTGTKKAEWRVTIRHQDKKMVARTRIELVTRGFSVLCSTNWATPPLWNHDLIGYDRFNIHLFYNLSSRLLKKIGIFPQRATGLRAKLVEKKQNPLELVCFFPTENDTPICLEIFRNL